MHIPVLLTEVLAMTEKTENPKLYLDCTFGRGGHLKAIKQKFPELRMIAVDRDQAALNHANDEFKTEIANNTLEMFKGNFMNLSQEWKGLPLDAYKFDLILADLGVSSPQLDQAERGFSFYHDGPLDMRMDQNQDLNAAQIVNTYSEQALIDLFVTFGEIPRPQKVVHRIIERRHLQEFTTTKELSDLVASADGWRKKGVHPATKYFLALRLKVNEEIDPLENAIYDLISRLNSNGRLLVITFHSMEDRIVKWAFKAAEDKGRIITKKVIQPKWAEKQKNARARSAQLRVFERGDV
jgi:16S rRNA (cytosine1402-N4)-methyltransferase